VEIDPLCDVAIIGGGPVGLATACTLKLLNENLSVCVFEKRDQATRHHPLRIQSDSINELVRTLQNSPFQSATKKALCQQLNQWKDRAISTAVIQDQLTFFANELGGRILKGEQAEFHKDSFEQFVQKTGAKIVIGADGAKSQVRQAIKAELENVFTFSYLLELKFKTASIQERETIQKIAQYSIAEGFDFETVGKKKDKETPITVSLHRFIDKDTHLQLKEKKDQIEKGTSEHPWNIRELDTLAKTRSEVKAVCTYFHRYFQDHHLTANDYSEDRIATFPIEIYRSSFVARRVAGAIVLLAGDASSGLVLERGVNKGFIEAGLCAQAVAKFFERPVFERSLMDDSTPLPAEFELYQKQAASLFFKESRWARIKFTVLKEAESAFISFVRLIKLCYPKFSEMPLKKRALELSKK
jgi:flavin-dependent dehydrogenase